MKKCIISFIIGLLIGSGTLYLINKHQDKVDKQTIENTIELYQSKIDSLQNEVSNFKPIIDTLYLDRTKIKIVYEEKDSIIWNQSADDDWIYFTNFLSSRFPSDSSTVERD